MVSNDVDITSEGILMKLGKALADGQHFLLDPSIASFRTSQSLARKSDRLTVLEESRTNTVLTSVVFQCKFFSRVIERKNWSGSDQRFGFLEGSLLVLRPVPRIFLSCQHEERLQNYRKMWQELGQIVDTA